MPEFGLWDEICSTELLSRSYRPKSRVELGRRMKEMYEPTRPQKSQVIGEIEVRPPMASADSLVVRADHVPGYVVLTIDEARAKFSEIRGVPGSWSADNSGAEALGEGLDFNSDSKDTAWRRSAAAGRRSESVH